MPLRRALMANETNILGISAFYHDSAACLVRDGVIVAAAQEERFTRKKHPAKNMTPPFLITPLPIA
jgi:predicted NodU family carbamoyl transferase